MAKKTTTVLLTIPAGTQETTARVREKVLRGASGLSIMAPAALTGTVTLRVSHDDADGAVHKALQSPPGTDVTVPADKVVVLTELPFRSIKLRSSTNEVAERHFMVTVTY